MGKGYIVNKLSENLPVCEKQLDFESQHLLNNVLSSWYFQES